MSTLPESNSWEAGIRQLEATDIAQGGAGGIMNLQASQLANRTVHLKSAVTALTSAQDGLAAEIDAALAAADAAQVAADLAVTAASNAQATANAGVSAAAAAKAKADTAQSNVDIIGQLAVLKDAPGSVGAARLPGGTTEQRPAGDDGMVRYNTTLGEYERYQSGGWVPFNCADKAINESVIVTVLAASLLNIGAAAANTMRVSGSTAIAGLGSCNSGVVRRLIFDNAPVLTHSASLLLPGGGNIAAASGDVAEFVSLGNGVWRCISYQRENGTAINQLDVLGARQWQNLTASRALGDTYTNTSGRQVEVEVSIGIGARVTVVVFVNETEVKRVNAGADICVGVSVPPLATYRVTGGSLLLWSELR